MLLNSQQTYIDALCCSSSLKYLRWDSILKQSSLSHRTWYATQKYHHRQPYLDLYTVYEINVEENKRESMFVTSKCGCLQRHAVFMMTLRDQSPRFQS
jgi:hypothetical protein